MPGDFLHACCILIGQNPSPAITLAALASVAGMLRPTLFRPTTELSQIYHSLPPDARLEIRNALFQSVISTDERVINLSAYSLARIADYEIRSAEFPDLWPRVSELFEGSRNGDHSPLIPLTLISELLICRVLPSTSEHEFGMVGAFVFQCAAAVLESDLDDSLKLVAATVLRHIPARFYRVPSTWNSFEVVGFMIAHLECESVRHGLLCTAITTALAWDPRLFQAGDLLEALLRHTLTFLEMADESLHFHVLHMWGAVLSESSASVFPDVIPAALVQPLIGALTSRENGTDAAICLAELAARFPERLFGEFSAVLESDQADVAIRLHVARIVARMKSPAARQMFDGFRDALLAVAAGGVPGMADLAFTALHEGFPNEYLVEAHFPALMDAVAAAMEADSPQIVVEALKTARAVFERTAFIADIFERAVAMLSGTLARPIAAESDEIYGGLHDCLGVLIAGYPTARLGEIADVIVEIATSFSNSLAPADEAGARQRDNLARVIAAIIAPVSRGLPELGGQILLFLMAAFSEEDPQDAVMRALSAYIHTAPDDGTLAIPVASVACRILRGGDRNHIPAAAELVAAALHGRHLMFGDAIGDVLRIAIDQIEAFHHDAWFVGSLLTLMGKCMWLEKEEIEEGLIAPMAEVVRPLREQIMALFSGLGRPLIESSERPTSIFITVIHGITAMTVLFCGEEGQFEDGRFVPSPFLLNEIGNIKKIIHAGWRRQLRSSLCARACAAMLKALEVALQLSKEFERLLGMDAARGYAHLAADAGSPRRSDQRHHSRS
jgi:hypothetical protein